jgi:hypothetical protein
MTARDDHPVPRANGSHQAHGSGPEEAWVGRETTGADGRRTGTVQTVYLDDLTGRPAWVVVSPGVATDHERFVPVAGARDDGRLIHLAHDRPTIEAAPRIEPGDRIGPQDERRLERHYAPGGRAGARASRPGEIDASSEPT